MSKEWYMMQPPPSYLSGYENEDFDYYSQEGFQEALGSFLGKDILHYGTKISETPTTIRAIVQNETSDNQEKTDVRQVLCAIGTLKCGQYLRFDGAYWLVSSLPGNNGIYEKAIVWYCKAVLNMKSRITGNVINYPVPTKNATQYNSGETNRSQMSIGSSQHLVYIPCDEETLCFDNDDRFLMDKNKDKPTSYRLTQVDSTSYAYGDIGLLQWTMVEDQLRTTKDDKTFMIADCYKETSVDVDVEPISEDGYSIVVADPLSTNEVISGEKKTFTVQFFNAGVEVDDFNYQVTIGKANDGNNVAELVTLDSNQFQIRAVGNPGSSCTITVSDTLNRADCQIKLRVIGWW